MRVVLIVTMNGRAEPIIDGVATDIEAQPTEGGNAKLIVKGKDLSALMDVVEIAGLPYPAMPPSVRVLAILAKYAAFGVIPMVIPAVVDEPPLPTERIPQHKGTDYGYVASSRRRWATSSTSSRARRRACRAPIGGRRSASACRSRH